MKRTIKRLASKILYSLTMGPKSAVKGSGISEKSEILGMSFAEMEDAQNRRNTSASVVRWSNILANMADAGIKPVPKYVPDPKTGEPNFVGFEYVRLDGQPFDNCRCGRQKSHPGEKFNLIDCEECRLDYSIRHSETKGFSDDEWISYCKKFWDQDYLARKQFIDSMIPSAKVWW